MPAVGGNQEAFSVRSEQLGNVAHLRISGELDTATSPVLEGWWLEGAEFSGTAAIVLDLENVTFVDSSGVHCFLRFAERARRSGRVFSIVNAPAAVQKVLQITRKTHLLWWDAPAPSSDLQLMRGSF